MNIAMNIAMNVARNLMKLTSISLQTKAFDQRYKVE